MPSPLTYPPSETPKIRGQDLSTTIPENPDNFLFSVPVENTPLNRSVCQNKGEMHLSQSPPKALESRHFLSPNLAHTGPETLPECEYGGRFFRGGDLKLGFPSLYEE